jgi:ribosomal protein L22
MTQNRSANTLTNDTFASDIRTLPDDELEQLVARAATEQERLKREHARLESEASSAADAFKVSPSQATLAAKEIGGQLAANALDVCTKHAATHTALFTESTRRKNMSRLHELRGLVNWRADAANAAQRITALYDRFAQDVLKELAAAESMLTSVHAHIDEANVIERRVGDGRQYPYPRFATAVALFNDELAARIGRFDEHQRPVAAQITHWVVNGQPTNARCEMRIRVHAPIAKELAE